MVRTKKIKKKFVEQTATIIVASVGLVAALAWNDAVQTLFQKLFGEISQIWAKFIYAFAVTLIAVIIVMVANYYKRK